MSEFLESLGSGPAREKFRRWYDSDGMHDLVLLAAVLRTAERIADGFTRDHPDGCGCDFCATVRWSEGIRKDVAGIAWTVGSVVGLVESAIPMGNEQAALTGGETYADDFRRMAAYCDGDGAEPSGG
jgi:hypothetical protein